MVGAAGIEPTTSSPPDLRDTTTLRPVKPVRIVTGYLTTLLARYHYATPRMPQYNTHAQKLQPLIFDIVQR